MAREIEPGNSWIASPLAQSRLDLHGACESETEHLLNNRKVIGRHSLQGGNILAVNGR